MGSPMVELRTLALLALLAALVLAQEEAPPPPADDGEGETSIEIGGEGETEAPEIAIDPFEEEEEQYSEIRS